MDKRTAAVSKLDALRHKLSEKEAALARAKADLAAKAANLANNLRRNAAEIDEMVRRYEEEKDQPYSDLYRQDVATQLVRGVNHHLLWMLPNLHADNLIGAAEHVNRLTSDIDRMRLELVLLQLTALELNVADAK